MVVGLSVLSVAASEAEEKPGIRRKIVGQPTERDIKIAACWVTDSVEGRPLETGSASMYDRSPWCKAMYSLNTSWLWEAWLELLAILLMLRAFYEPAASFTGFECERKMSTAGTLQWLGEESIEAAVVCCFLFDVYTKLQYMRPEVYFHKAWHSFYLLVVGCLTVDAVFGAACGQRPFRLLRPMLIFLRNREQRRVLMSLIHLISHQLGVALVLMGVVVAFAGALAVHLYGSTFDKGVELQLHGAADDNHLKGTFNSVLHASLEVWVLISSAENFLDLLLPALHSEDGEHTWGPLFFFFPVCIPSYRHTSLSRARPPHPPPSPPAVLPVARRAGCTPAHLHRARTLTAPQPLPKPGDLSRLLLPHVCPPCRRRRRVPQRRAAPRQAGAPSAGAQSRQSSPPSFHGPPRIFSHRLPPSPAFSHLLPLLPPPPTFSHHLQRSGLFKAFARLNPSKSGYVDVPTWTRLMRALTPRMSRQEAILRYHMIALETPSRGVHVREFLRLPHNLSVVLTEDEHSERPLLPALPDTLRLAVLVADALAFVSYSPLQPMWVRHGLFAAHTLTLPLLILDRKSWLPGRRALSQLCLGTAIVSAFVYWAHVLWMGVAPPVASQVCGQVRHLPISPQISPNIPIAPHISPYLPISPSFLGPSSRPPTARVCERSQVAMVAMLAHTLRVMRLILRLLALVLPEFLSVSASVVMLVYSFAIAGMQVRTLHTISRALVAFSHLLWRVWPSRACSSLARERLRRATHATRTKTSQGARRRLARCHAPSSSSSRCAISPHLPDL